MTCRRQPRNSAQLPPRYAEDWRGNFYGCIGSRLSVAHTILDIGSGRSPAIPLRLRPDGCCYVGLDVSLAELQLAPPGSYDETVCADLTTPQPELTGRFDLVVSMNLFEHLAEPDVALAHVRSYLTDGGRMVALLSGRYACFALANRLLPARMARRVAAYVTSREPETVFRAYYRDCYYGGLRRVLHDWSRCEIYPKYRGEVYFRFSRAGHRAYLAYESWAHRTSRRNLATHYFVVAEP
jgi:SAM-dependent methyltransferase